MGMETDFRVLIDGTDTDVQYPSADAAVAAAIKIAERPYVEELLVVEVLGRVIPKVYFEAAHRAEKPAPEYPESDLAKMGK
jgi:hypothetical protein